MKNGNNLKNKKKFAVLQLGSRHSYAIPYVLFKNKNLKVFYTDAHSNHFVFQLIKLIIPNRFLPKKLKGLLERKLPSNFLKRFIKDSPLWAIIFNSNSKKLASLVLNNALNEEFSGANAIYTNFINEDFEYIKKAKNNGIHIVHEMFISPHSGLIMYEENKRFSGLSFHHETRLEVERGITLDKKKWELCDQILVPSKFCKDSALKMGVDAQKLSLVPYGIKKDFFNLKTRVQKGKILFVGEIGLRKGAHYLAMASRILSDRGRHYNFVGAGFKTVDTNHSVFEGITFLGHLTESELIYQYLTSDIFVLPTLVEGMAISHLEAMACGLPIITTPNCGSVITNYKEGFIVPIRDPKILSSKIEEIVEDRNLRNEMSNRCKKKAVEYTWANYRNNLLSALNI